MYDFFFFLKEGFCMPPSPFPNTHKSLEPGGPEGPLKAGVGLIPLIVIST